MHLSSISDKIKTEGVTVTTSYTSKFPTHETANKIAISMMYNTITFLKN
jgi:hypothetical protein